MPNRLSSSSPLPSLLVGRSSSGGDCSVLRRASFDFIFFFSVNAKCFSPSLSLTALSLSIFSFAPWTGGVRLFLFVNRFFSGGHVRIVLRLWRLCSGKLLSFNLCRLFSLGRLFSSPLLRTPVPMFQRPFCWLRSTRHPFHSGSLPHGNALAPFFLPHLGNLYSYCSRAVLF